MKTLSIIPTYNERENLPLLVDAIFGLQPSVHLLVVDDGSPDGTGDLADGSLRGMSASMCYIELENSGLARLISRALSGTRAGLRVYLRDGR